MFRFFSLAVLVNWLALVAMIGVVGIGFEGQSTGLIAAIVSVLTAETSFGLEFSLARAIAMTGALSVLAAGLWSIMAVLFADKSLQHNQDQDFVVSASLGYCLMLFAGLLGLALATGDHLVGMLSCVSSMTTILAGVALRMTSAQAQAGKTEAEDEAGSFSLTRARSMASQSANLASVGARGSRFTPKHLHFNPNTNP